MATDYKKAARQIARRHGIREGLFLSLISHESGWNPNAVSPAGALGLGQLMPGTAAGLGVDPRDPIQNLEGAARYLASQLKRFGSEKLALAAYNAGPGAVEKYGGVPPYAETQRYVRNVLGGAGAAHQPAKGKRGGRSAANAALAGQYVPQEPVAMAPDFTGVALGNLGDIASTGKFNPTASLSRLVEALASQPSPEPLAQSPGLAPRNGAAAPTRPAASGPQSWKGLHELFYDPKGAYDEGSFIKAIGGHGDHLHASITDPATMVALIRLAQARGLRVSENPWVDKVDPVHTNGSFHYRKQKYKGREIGDAVDIGGNPAALAALYDDILRRAGVRR